MWLSRNLFWVAGLIRLRGCARFRLSGCNLNKSFRSFDELTREREQASVVRIGLVGYLGRAKFH